MRSIPCLVLLLVALAPSAGADAVALSDGRVLVGRVLETTDDGIRLALENGSEVLVPIEFVAPTSYYGHRKAALAEGDHDGRMRLARYCLENDLLAEAEALGRAVGAADPTRAAEVAALLERLDERRATRILELARQARARGELEEALELVKKVLIDHEASGAAAAAERELDEIVTLLEEERRRLVERRLAGGGGAAPGPGPAPARSPDRARFERIVAYVDDLIARGEAAYRTGLEWDGRGVVNKGSDAYQDSIAAYRLALEGLAHAARRTDDPADLAALEAKAAAVRKTLVESYVAGGYLHASQRNWKMASRFVDGALAVDPAHEYALKLRQRISQEYIRRSAFQRAIGEAHQLPGPR